MVGTAGNETEQQSGPLDGKDGRYQRDIGEMGAAGKGVVQQHRIPRREGGESESSLHGGRHTAEVYGNVCGLGDHPPGGVKDGARVVAALLDIRRKGGASQRRSHLFGHRAEEMPKDLQADGIDGGGRTIHAACPSCAHVCSDGTGKDVGGRCPWPIRRAARDWVQFHDQGGSRYGTTGNGAELRPAVETRPSLPPSF